MTQAFAQHRGFTQGRAFEQGRRAVSGREAADRRDRSSRAACDRILDRTDATERRKAADALCATARNQPLLIEEQRRIQAHRIRLVRRGEGLAVAGALAILGMVAASCMTAAPLGVQATSIIVGGLGLAGFRLAIADGRERLTLQIVLQLLGGFILVGLAASGAAMGLPVAIGLMGCAALALRSAQLSAARRLDIDEVELLLAAQGRQTVWAVREDMQRRAAAAI